MGGGGWGWTKSCRLLTFAAAGPGNYLNYSCHSPAKAVLGYNVQNRNIMAAVWEGT